MADNNDFDMAYLAAFVDKLCDIETSGEFEKILRSFYIEDVV